MKNRVRGDALLGGLPDEWPEPLLQEIQSQVRASGRKVVVLDDDPTGTQTVHGIPVLTEWPVPALVDELASSDPAFYILTNSRSLPAAGAQALNAEIGLSLAEAARSTGREFVLVSRSDSTLRGHFPGEIEALAKAVGQHFHAWLLVPFFLEGGRYTIEDVHYVAEGDWFVPAGETEFAQDAAFGYRASNLREWVQEKTAGDITAVEVLSISLDDIRNGGPEQVRRALMRLQGPAQACVVNAAGYRDLEVFVLGLLQAEAEGLRCLYRTAASFVRVRAGIESQPLLNAADLHLPTEGGALIVAGSYVPKTTAQLAALRNTHKLVEVEIDVQHLLNDAARTSVIGAAVERVNEGLGSGKDVLVFTSRQLLLGGDAHDSLAIGSRISQSLVEVVHGLQVRPRYLLAKGGITSSDVATAGLGVKRAMVMGQILPGVPVWQLGEDSRFPYLPYIVFPGNVGGPEALSQVVRTLSTG